MVKLKDFMDEGAAKLGTGVKFAGLLLQKAHIKHVAGKLPSDILGWDYIFRTVDGVCYNYYAAHPHLLE